MQRRAIESALMALSLAMFGTPSFAADPSPLPTSPSAPAASAPAISKKDTRKAPVVLVDINSASRAQLKTLPGIGDADADRIIAGRPYFSKADLVSKKVLPAGVYLALKGRIIARQQQQPKRKD